MQGSELRDFYFLGGGYGFFVAATRGWTDGKLPSGKQRAKLGFGSGKGNKQADPGRREAGGNLGPGKGRERKGPAAGGGQITPPWQGLGPWERGRAASAPPRSPPDWGEVIGGGTWWLWGGRAPHPAPGGCSGGQRVMEPSQGLLDLPAPGERRVCKGVSVREEPV